ncbi:MAG TPA: hypothetical protein VM223_14800, partial [Planctomycetota bacterium]|nr:hypothetical protein [Planctomycetota bacterium]
EAVKKIAAGREKPREHVVIGEKQIIEFLAERGPEGISISAEQPAFMPAARKLAEAIRKAFGKEARITRNAPRIGFGTAGVGHRMGNSFGIGGKTYYFEFWVVDNVPVILSEGSPFNELEVTMGDRHTVLAQYGWRLPGDYNDDCAVNILDVIYVRNRLQSKCSE